MEMWDTSVDFLYQIAMQNTPSILPFVFERMDDYFERVMEHPFPFLEDLHMYLLSNKIKIHGASCMAYPGLLKTLANELDDNLVIIPSSIHELLILPKTLINKRYNIEHLNQMVRDVNETQLTDDEILSDHIYLYMRDSEEIIY